jgi:hypothetical protein
MKTAVAAIFRDEAKYLKEWVEFHLLVGFDLLYMFNNLSQDNYLEVLNPYIESGQVIAFNLDILDLDCVSNSLRN